MTFQQFHFLNKFGNGFFKKHQTTLLTEEEISLDFDSCANLDLERPAQPWWTHC